MEYWCTWLSKTNLEPSLVHEYAHTFAHNELVQDDIPYFNHEFLQSMGISVAKHRQEILKLAKKEKARSSRNHMLWLLVAIKQAKKLVAKRLKMWTCRPDSVSSFAVAPLRNYSTRWKAAVLKRNIQLASAKQETPTRVVTDKGMLKRLNGMRCFKA
ncbi:hypothetical protein K7X08_004087 [Anisodus acutangulus]|uniref:SAM domain-containing protein n=1 Tax=Anisodus acutangulus TaxID=402998 RepID=A0A9Q1MI13_9SOLA|nr:hypothetical protein K7X08_004087 [Anisodus acutangulus]